MSRGARGAPATGRAPRPRPGSVRELTNPTGENSSEHPAFTSGHHIQDRNSGNLCASR